MAIVKSATEAAKTSTLENPGMVEQRKEEIQLASLEGLVDFERPEDKSNPINWSPLYNFRSYFPWISGQCGRLALEFLHYYDCDGSDQVVCPYYFSRNLPSQDPRKESWIAPKAEFWVCSKI
jgi:hypothetical protein